MRADGIAGADTHHARGRIFQLGIFVFRFAQKLQRFFHRGEDLFSARVGQFHALVRAVKELPAQLIFQLFDRLRNGGLRNVQLFRRLGEAAAFCDRIKYAI